MKLALHADATVGIAAGREEELFTQLWSEYDLNFTICNGDNPARYDWPVKGKDVNVHSFWATVPLILALKDELFSAGARVVRVMREDRRSDYIEFFFPDGSAEVI